MDWVLRDRSSLRAELKMKFWNATKREQCKLCERTMWVGKVAEVEASIRS